MKKLRPLRPKNIVIQPPISSTPGGPPQQTVLPKEARGPIVVGVPTGRHNICSGTVKSLFSAYPYLSQFGFASFYSHAGSLIHVARQETVDMAYKVNARWLWFVDDDMSFPAHTPIDLAKSCIEHDFAMCSALSIKRVPPYSPTVGMRLDEEGEPMLTPEDVPSSGVHEVMHTGLACTVIDLEKLKQVGLNMNSKLFYMQVNEANTKMIGEDLAFCKILQSKGLKVGLNANIWTGHIGVHEFQPSIWFQHWREIFVQKKKENEELRKQSTQAAELAKQDDAMNASSDVQSTLIQAQQ